MSPLIEQNFKGLWVGESVEQLDRTDLPKVSILIPAYNEGEAIRVVLDKLRPYIEEHGFEVIVINDASKDNTSEIAHEFQYVTVIDHPYNKGYVAALKTGTFKARGEYVLTMDADGQHDPAEIPKLLEHMKHFDMVIGARKNGGDHHWKRKPGKLILRWVANYITGINIPDLNSGFRLIRRYQVIERRNLLPNGFSFSTTITLSMLVSGRNVQFIPISTSNRTTGKSAVNQARDGIKTLLLIARCIMLFNPLKIFVPSAMFLFGAGLLHAIYGIIEFSSFPKTAIIGILAGIFAFLFGLLADQIAAIRRDMN